MRITKMEVRKVKKQKSVICFITIIALVICIMTAGKVRDLHIQETVLFLVSAVWVVLFTVANWKKLWK
jgi:hypothetical protein